MHIDRITAKKDSIVISGDLSGTLAVIESSPTVGGDSRTIRRQIKAEAKDGRLVIDRFPGGTDSLYSRFAVVSGSSPVPGVKYVTDVSPEAQADTSDYPQPDIIKTIGATPDLVSELGIRQGLMNVNLPNIMSAKPRGDDTIEYEFRGGKYYFIKSAVESIDSYMKSVPMMTMILLNSPRLFGSTGEKELLDACVHPKYDWGFRDAYISAFDMERDEGQGYYAAFVSFLASRYTRPDRKYGRLVGVIVSNEVNSQYIWGNAGDMTVEDYVEEYAEALRLAWQCGQNFSRAFRVYISLDQFFCGANFDPSQRTRYYSGRRMLELLSDVCRRDGDFPWNVAYHPYPEDLRWADFWHDRCPDFTYSTPKITFKNMEVLEAYMAQTHMLYRGQPRRLIFSEQGFNSRGDGLKEITEEWAAAAYTLAYMKARNMKTLDLFTHHAYRDNPHEFGLNLGIRRFDADAPGTLGERKPIYYAVEDMDTAREADRIEQAKKIIGEKLFDYLLHPPIETGERDGSKDGDFFSQPRKEEKSDFMAGNDPSA